ncbi:MAG: type III pantothenate kinase [Clostridia bacterium]|nr:type III pantothenate kinase [Clostridia bacterium]
MLLAVDIGNTNITFGCYKEDELIFVSRMYTEKRKSSDEFAVKLLDMFSLYKVSADDFSGAILSSVVPQLTDIISRAIKLTIGKNPLLVGKEHNGNLKVDILPIEQLGADLICGCVGAVKKHKLPCLVVDMGTATKILAIDENEYFVGCIISPGVKVSLDALASNAALLPSISFTKPKNVVGTNTVECMQSGSVYGAATMIDGLTRRMSDELGFKSPTIVSTGGYSKGIIPCCETEIVYDENLLLDGLREIYLKSKEKNYG